MESCYGSVVRGECRAGLRGPFIGDWLADTDGDGFTDGVEFALGTSSSNPASAPEIGITAGIETVGATTARFLRLTFRRIASNHAIVTPELSVTLSPWNNGAASFTRLQSVNNGDGTATEVWRTSAPVTGPGAFARLRATAP